MPSFNTKVPELGFISSGERPASPDNSIAIAVSGIGKAATQLKKGVDKMQEAEDSAQANVVVNKFENQLIEAGKQNVGGFVQRSEEFDEDLTADDISNLTEAKEAAGRIDALERQGKSANAVQLERITTYQRFVSQYPHLAPELRGFFKKSTGKGVLQSVIDLEKDVATQATEELEAEKKIWVDFSVANNMYDANESHQQRVSRLTPIMDEMTRIQSSKRQLEQLKTDREVSHEKRRAAQETAFRSGFSGFVIAADMSVSKLLAESNFDPESSTAEDRQTLIQQLNARKVATEAELRNAGSDLETTYLENRLNMVTQQFDNGIDYVTGAKTKELYQNSNAIRLAAATNRLLEVPGMDNKMVALEKFKGLDPKLLGFKERAKFGAEVLIPISKALLLHVDNPDVDAYPELATVATNEEQTNFYADLSTIATKNLDNEEVQQQLSNVLEAYTNNWATDPGKPPTGVYDKMMQVSSQKGFIEVLDKGVNLPANFIEGIQEYTTRVQESVANDLGKDLSARVPTGELKHSTQSKGFFQYIFGVPSVDPLNTSNVPKLFELLDVIPQKDGSLIFQPTQGASQLPKARQLARDVTRKYGKRVGELVRSYAHTVQRDEDYKGAYKTILGAEAFGDLTEALSVPSGADLPKPQGLPQLTRTILGKTDEGRPIVQNEDGSVSTERTITITDDRINGGKPTNIPSMFGGKEVSEQEAIEIISKAKGKDPETGRKLKGFSSIQEAVTSAQQRSKGLL